MNKSVAFKQPKYKPTPDDWVSRRVVEPVENPEPPTVQVASVTVIEKPVQEAIPASSVAATLAPKVVMERAVCRVTTDIDEQLRARLKILCVRTRQQVNAFLAKAIEDAVIEGELELEKSV